MALLLPSTFAMHPATALIMLAGIYYGAMYGGSTTSILVNVPGEAGSVVTLLDGYQMTRKGRAGAALTIAAVGSFVAGTVGVVGIMLAAGWLADVAIRFGPAGILRDHARRAPAALPPVGRLDPQCLRDGRARPGPRHRRDGFDLGAAAVHVRLRAARAGHRARARDHGRLRRGGGAAPRGGGDREGADRQREAPRAPADARRVAALDDADRARLRRRLPHRARARPRRGAVDLHLVHASRRKCRRRPRSSAPA